MRIFQRGWNRQAGYNYGHYHFKCEKILEVEHKEDKTLKPYKTKNNEDTNEINMTEIPWENMQKIGPDRYLFWG